MQPDIRYPLHYPPNWKRTRFPKSSQFDRSNSRTFAQARDELLKELELLGATNVILSSNIPLRKDGLPYANFRQPDDRGVAVYFNLGKKPIALACDQWDRVVDNVWAIAKHINALRGQQRWGVGTIEQAFMGYQALPDSVEPRRDSWWVVLGVPPTATWEEVKTAYRRAAKNHHPDVGGDRKLWDAIQQAYAEADRALKVREGS